MSSTPQELTGPLSVSSLPSPFLSFLVPFSLGGLSQLFPEISLGDGSSDFFFALFFFCFASFEELL
jgi:hypothetical protein